MELILGGPGCGKTTYLMGVVEQEMASGVKPHEIALLAFTRKAAHEARERAAVRFGLSQDKLPYFRTLHSFAFRQLHLSGSELMQKDDYTTLGKPYSLKFSELDENAQVFETPSGMQGAHLAFVEQLSRLTHRPVEELLLSSESEKIKDKRMLDLYVRALHEYKRARAVYDYTDMLEMFVSGQGECPRFKVVIIDEAQDLCPLQWEMVWRICSGVERVYIAGDDDQAIYEWSGADVRTFLNLQGNIKVLPLSHRLPQRVFAKAQDVLRSIKHRYAKQWEPKREGGNVARYEHFELVDLSEGEWYVLGRNRYQLPAFLKQLRFKGLPYIYEGRSSVNNDEIRSIIAWETLRRGESITSTQAKEMVEKLRPGAFGTRERKALVATDDLVTFEYLANRGLTIPKAEDWMAAVRIKETDREYYRAIRQRGESLIKSPRITVSTIHQVKGGEVDHVLLSTDISMRCHRSLHADADSESRVFYVGATRARQSLHILHNRTTRYFHHI